MGGLGLIGIGSGLELVGGRVDYLGGLGGVVGWGVSVSGVLIILGFGGCLGG